jgi:dihydroorotate dehydrogenase (NAD+) catalytic subunit
VYAGRRATALPIVGMGGVMTGRHALELLAAGANDVALGTVLFADPAAPGRIRAELEAELAARGFADPDNIVDAAHAHDPSTLDPKSRLSAEKHLHTGLNVAG